MAKSVFIPIPGEQRLSAILQKGMLGLDGGDGDAPDAAGGKTLVVMIHGFPGHKAARNDVFGELEFHLAKDDFHTLRFDFRGCGESEGKSEDFTLKTAVEDMASVLSWARSFGYERFFYIGEGLGATIALLSLNASVRGAVLLWPVLDPRLTGMKDLMAAAGDKEREFVIWRDTKIGLPFIKEIKSFNPMRKLRNLKVPLLIQQGDADEEVSPRQMEMLRRHARSARRIEMTTYEGGGHGLPGLNERQTMIYHVRQFLKRYA